MRKIFLPLILLSVGCSAPRYYGYFGHQSYRFPVPSADQVAQRQEKEVTVAMAAADEDGQLRQVVALTPSAPVSSPVQVPMKAARKFSNRKAAESVRFTSYHSPVFAGLDDDLKMAIILGAAGLTGLFLVILSQVFGILGGLLLIGGVIFFTRWMLRQ